MASKDRFAKLKVYKYTPGGMALPFVLLFAGLGTYVITQSRADSVSYAGFYNSSNVLPSAGVYPATDSVNASGSQNVNQVSAGSKLTYAGSTKSKFKSICYYVRLAEDLGGETSAKIEFVGKGSFKTVTLAKSNAYQSICVKSSNKTQKSYNIYNTSGPNGPDVLVYQAITSS